MCTFSKGINRSFFLFCILGNCLNIKLLELISCGFQCKFTKAFLIHYFTYIGLVYLQLNNIPIRLSIINLNLKLLHCMWASYCNIEEGGDESMALIVQKRIVKASSRF